MTTTMSDQYPFATCKWTGSSLQNSVVGHTAFYALLASSRSTTEGRWWRTANVTRYSR